MCVQGSLRHVLKKQQWKQTENNHKSGKQTQKTLLEIFQEIVPAQLDRKF